MRTVGELAVSEGVSYAEGVRLSVSRGQVEGEDASDFIHGLRRYGRKVTKGDVLLLDISSKWTRLDKLLGSSAVQSRTSDTSDIRSPLL